MAGGGKAEVGTDGGYGFVGIAEEAFGFLRFFFEDEICQAFAGFFLEFPGEIGAAEEEMACDLVHGDGFGEVLLDVIGHIYRQLGGVLSQVQPFHPLGIVQDHTWDADVEKIQQTYPAQEHQNGIIFYGASNFRMWTEMEDDLPEYRVQNHGFGGCTDEDLMHYADKLLYPDHPDIVFFQTGSNDYVSLKGTDEEKVAACMDYKKKMFKRIANQIRKNIPAITHSDTEWYVGNAAKGTRIGYKYFSIQDNTILRVTARGRGRVCIKINGRSVGSLPYHSEKWAAASLTIPQGGPHTALWLTVTEGSLDILSLHFSQEVTE